MAKKIITGHKPKPFSRIYTSWKWTLYAGISLLIIGLLIGIFLQKEPGFVICMFGGMSIVEALHDFFFGKVWILKGSTTSAVYHKKKGCCGANKKINRRKAWKLGYVLCTKCVGKLQEGGHGPDFLNTYISIQS